MLNIDISVSESLKGKQVFFFFFFYQGHLKLKFPTQLVIFIDFWAKYKELPTQKITVFHLPGYSSVSYGDRNCI